MFICLGKVAELGSLAVLRNASGSDLLLEVRIVKNQCMTDTRCGDKSAQHVEKLELCGPQAKL